MGLSTVSLFLRCACALLLVLALSTPGWSEVKGAGPLKVALLLEDSKDAGYADVLVAGLHEAQKKWGIVGDIILSPRPDKQEEDFLRVAKAGYDLVIVPHVPFHTLLINNAGNFPATRFASINAQIKAPNVLSFTFADAEGAFLAGAAAALITQELLPETTKNEPEIELKIGWIGGPDIPQSLGYLAGYRQGAKHVLPAVRVISLYAGSFNDPPAGQQAAESLYKDGVQIIMNAAERSGQGIFRAADKAGKYAIGCISNQNGLSPQILFSLQKHADKAVLAAVQAVREGSFKGGTLVQFNLANGGLSLSPLQNLPPALASTLAPRLEQLAKDIQNQKIKVDSGAPRGLCDCL